MQGRLVNLGNVAILSCLTIGFPAMMMDCTDWLRYALEVARGSFCPDHGKARRTADSSTRAIAWQVTLKGGTT